MRLVLFRIVRFIVGVLFSRVKSDSRTEELVELAPGPHCKTKAVVREKKRGGKNIGTDSSLVYFSERPPWACFGSKRVGVGKGLVGPCLPATTKKTHNPVTGDRRGPQHKANLR